VRFRDVEREQAGRPVCHGFAELANGSTMSYQAGITFAILTPVISLSKMGSILQHNLDTTVKLDGSVSCVKRLLQELVELAGQDDYIDATPVLELQFGEVLTRTTLSVKRGIQCLSVVAELPRTEKLNYLSPPSRLLDSSLVSDSETELLWHADEGRYAVVSNTPISEIAEDVSVLDTILDTSEQARAWFSVVRACAPASL
jgi:hypothetical protein